MVNNGTKTIIHKRPPIVLSIILDLAQLAAFLQNISLCQVHSELILNN